VRDPGVGSDERAWYSRLPGGGKNWRKFPGKSLHLAVGHLQEDVDAGHPGNERFGILIRPPALASVHPGKVFIPLINKVKGEGELSAPHQAFIIYTSIASVRVRGTPAFFLRHGRPAGASVIFTFVVGGWELFNTAHEVAVLHKH